MDEVSLTVAPGTVTAVLGANGAGKTMLLRTISALKRARSGRITLDGGDIQELGVEAIVRRGLAHVPEGRGVITELAVAENLRLGGLWRRADALPVDEMCMSCSRDFTSVAASRPRRCPAAGARCSRSAVR